MGKRGPKPKPNEIKAREGNPGQRPLVEDDETVDLSFGTLRMPMRLSVDERKIWKDTLSAFPSWYFRPADRELLTAYCRAVRRMDKSEKALRKTSAISKRGNGGTCLSPHMKIINDSLNQVLRLSEILRMTPEKRKMVGVPDVPVPADTPSEPVGDDQEFPDGLIRKPRLVRNG